MAYRLQMHCTFLLGNTPSEQMKKTIKLCVFVSSIYLMHN